MDVLPYETTAQQGDASGRAGGVVVTLTLSQPHRPVVVLDSALIEQLAHTLDEITRTYADTLAGLVLASDSRVFVAGANLEELDQLDDDAAHTYLRRGSAVFLKLAQLPVTTVAAINGAALGGGLEIAMHCDRIVACEPQAKLGPDGEVVKPAKPYLVGLPEAGLGLCPGWGGSLMLPARMRTEADIETAIVATAEGRAFTVDEAAQLGVVEELLPDRDAMLARAIELASAQKPEARSAPLSIGDGSMRDRVRPVFERVRGALPDTDSARAVARCIEAALASPSGSGWGAGLEQEQEHLVRLRRTPAAREKLDAFFAKSGAKANS